MKIKVAIEDKTYLVNIQDTLARPVIAEVDGKTYEVWPEEEPSLEIINLPSTAPATAAPPQPTPKAPAPELQSSSSLTLVAPLPGVIISVETREGENVKNGQQLLTLEAMKMKNIIRSNRDGVIAKINVTAGDLVRHNQPLLTFQD